MSDFLETEALKVQFAMPSAPFARLRRRRRLVLRAVDGIDLRIERGQRVGIVGESGCGKSTLARAIVGLVDATDGCVRFEGRELGRRRSPAERRRIQMVFQDPIASLNPRLTVEGCLSELLRAHRLVEGQRVRARCVELLEMVEMPERLLRARPGDLSGGQRQRVAIARALAVEPEVLIADEAVAALDVSVQAAVLNLLSDLCDRTGLTLVLISHDLTVVRAVCEVVNVMYLGRLVETGPTETIFEYPRHPYTRALLSAAPVIATRREDGGPALTGDPPSPLALPEGCRFHPRCAIKQATPCELEEPALIGRGAHAAACHFAWTAASSEADIHTVH